VLTIVHSNEVVIAGATSLLWWKRIRLSDRFYALPDHKQFAVIMHEFGHLFYHHTEKRILCLIFTPWRLIPMMHRQEFEADRYAASLGGADALIEMLQGVGDGELFHPSNADRRAALKKYEIPRPGSKKPGSLSPR
jgi:Zn-dependent protease with chaperone function